MKKIASIIVLIAVILALAVPVSAASTGYSSAAAINIALGQTYTKGWNSTNDSYDHYVKFTTPSDGIITISYERPVDSEGEAQDLTYELYTSTGVLAWKSSTQYCNQIASTLDLSVAIPAGTYYLNTDAGFYVTRGTIYCDYMVSFTANSYAEKEPNSGTTTATLMTAGYAYTGHAGGSSFELDYFKFYVESNKKVTLVMTNYEALKDSNDTSAYFHFVNSQGTERKYLSFKLRSDGKYVVECDATAGYNYFYIDAYKKQVEYTIMVEVPKGTGWYAENGGYRYYKDSEMQTGWLQEGSNWYYLGADGMMQTGWVNTGGKWYYFKSNGVMATGWTKDGADQYYLNSSGQYVTGWQKFGGACYYFASSGKMATGWQYINGCWYYFKSNGVMATGWTNDGANWYYMDGNGQYKTGWFNDGFAYYYFAKDGKMATGWQIVGGKWYYFNSAGMMATGWTQVGTDWYYLDSNGQYKTGWQQLGGAYYYFASSGKMATGWQYINGSWYFFKSSGVMATGWQGIGGSWYYFASSGKMTTGWLQLSGKWYFMESSGKMVTGTKVINNKTYVFNNSGVWVA